MTVREIKGVLTFPNSVLAQLRSDDSFSTMRNHGFFMDFLDGTDLILVDLYNSISLLTQGLLRLLLCALCVKRNITQKTLIKKSSPYNLPKTKIFGIPSLLRWLVGFHWLRSACLLQPTYQLHFYLFFFLAHRKAGIGYF